MIGSAGLILPIVWRAEDETDIPRIEKVAGEARNGRSDMLQVPVIIYGDDSMCGFGSSNSDPLINESEAARLSRDDHIDDQSRHSGNSILRSGSPVFFDDSYALGEPKDIADDEVDIENHDDNVYHHTTQSHSGTNLTLHDLDFISNQPTHVAKFRLEQVQKDITQLDIAAAESLSSTTMEQHRILIAIRDKIAGWLWRRKMFGRLLSWTLCASFLSTTILGVVIILLVAHQGDVDRNVGIGFIRFVFAFVFSVFITLHLWRYRLYMTKLRLKLVVGQLDHRLTAMMLATTIWLVVGSMVMMRFENWSYPEAVGFWIVTYTTVGYGNVVPESTAGIVFLFTYGSFGLVIFAACLLGCCAEFVAWFKVMSSKLKPQIRKNSSFQSKKYNLSNTVNYASMFLLVLSFWFGGALVFTLCEDWSYFQALFFCYQTLTTIGYGNLIPVSPVGVLFWRFYCFLGVGVLGVLLGGMGDKFKQVVHGI